MLWIEMKADTVGQPCANASKIKRRIEPGQRRAADIVADVDAADAELGRLAHHVDRKMLLLIPADRVRRDFFRGKIPRHIANRNLVLVESELHSIFAPVRETAATVNSSSESRTPRLP